jgi:hypothetical protein
MIDNKAIFHYLNPEGCWHEGLGDGTLARCEKCGEFWTHTDREPGDWPNPDYTTEHGFFLLLEGLRAKGIGVGFRRDPNGLCWIAELFEPTAIFKASVHPRNIRIALAEAVMQLIAKDGEL